MILIQEILISEDIVTEHFACHLNRCKGACCIEGDFGAPLEEAELNIIKDLISKTRPFLSKESLQKIDDEGFATYNSDLDIHETALMEDGACVFMGREESGITYCSIEKAYNEGHTTWKKPISCHLYPIRVTHNKKSNFQALNYDKWDICSAACSLGEKQQIRLYEFAKEAIIRKYGQNFYLEIEAAAAHVNKSKVD